MKLQFSKETRPSGGNASNHKRHFGRLLTFFVAAAAFLPLAAGCAREKPPAIRAPVTQVVAKKDTIQATKAPADTTKKDTAQADVKKEPRMDTVRITVKVVHLHHSIETLKRLYTGISGEANEWFLRCTIFPQNVTLSHTAQTALPPLIRMPSQPPRLDTPGLRGSYLRGKVPPGGKPCDTLYRHDTLFVYRTNMWKEMASGRIELKRTNRYKEVEPGIFGWKRVSREVDEDGMPLLTFEYELKSKHVVHTTIPAFSYDTAWKSGPLLIRKHVRLRPRHAPRWDDTTFDTANVSSSAAPYATVYRHDTLPIYKIPHNPDTMRLVKIKFRDREWDTDVKSFYSADDTARPFSLLRAEFSAYFPREHWMNGGALNFCAFRNIVAQVSGVKAENTFIEPIIEINPGQQPGISLYLLPVTFKNGKPKPVGKYNGGRLALGFTYSPGSNALEQGTYLLLEPDAPDTLESRKIRFTAVYSFVRTYYKEHEDKYAGTPASGYEPHYARGFIEEQCAKYLILQGLK